MESNTFMMPIASKYILRSTGEEVEVIDFNLPNRGMRTETKDLTLTFDEGDWVTYIDFNGKEHIKEHLNIQLDFKAVANDTFGKLLDIAKPNKFPSTRNNRIFEVAKALLVNNDYSDVEDIVSKATELVDKVGIETD